MHACELIVRTAAAGHSILLRGRFSTKPPPSAATNRNQALAANSVSPLPDISKRSGRTKKKKIQKKNERNGTLNALPTLFYLFSEERRGKEGEVEGFFSPERGTAFA